MSQTIQEKNKALVLEAFDTLFNKRDYEAAEKVLVAQLHSAQRAHRTGSRRTVQFDPQHTPHAALRTSAHRRGGRLCHRAWTILRNRPACRMGRRRYCQDRERPSCRTLGRVTRRGDQSRIEERPADVRRPLHCLSQLFRPSTGIDRDLAEALQKLGNEGISAAFMRSSGLT